MIQTSTNGTKCCRGGGKPIWGACHKGRGSVAVAGLGGHSSPRSGLPPPPPPPSERALVKEHPTPAWHRSGKGIRSFLLHPLTRPPLPPVSQQSDTFGEWTGRGHLLSDLLGAGAGIKSGASEHIQLQFSTAEPAQWGALGASTQNGPVVL